MRRVIFVRNPNSLANKQIPRRASTNNNSTKYRSQKCLRWMQEKHSAGDPMVAFFKRSSYSRDIWPKKTQMLTHFVNTWETENFQKSSDFGAAWLCSVWWYSKRGVHIESTNKPWSSRIMVFLKRGTLPFSWSQVWNEKRSTSNSMLFVTVLVSQFQQDQIGLERSANWSCSMFCVLCTVGEVAWA